MKPRVKLKVMMERIRTMMRPTRNEENSKTDHVG
jgi:hypothetical protein